MAEPRAQIVKPVVRIATVVVVSICWTLGFTTPAAAQSYGFFRFDDDFTALAASDARTNALDAVKYIPLGPSVDEYLSFGADDREKWESVEHPGLGLLHTGNYTDHLHRLLLNANLRYDSVRVFLELGNHTESGRLPGPTPTDIDRGDVQQAFVDIQKTLFDTPTTLRLGRQEMSYGEGLLVGVRDGPNIRQDWDGVRLFGTLAGARIDVFAVRPTANRPGYWDDTPNQTQALWGTYVTGKPAAIHALGPFALDLYYLGSRNDDLRLGFGAGVDARSTLGARVYGNAGGFDTVLESIGQFGRFDERDVRAFAIHTEAGWTFKSIEAAPRIGLKCDVLSGNRNPTTGTVSAFNPLYPNLAYSTEATIEAASNLIQAGTTLAVTPANGLTLTYEFESLWRESTRDSFYAAPLIPLVPPGVGSNQRFTGTEQQIYATWRVDPKLAFKAALVDFAVGPYVRAAHGVDTRYAMLSVSARF